MPATRGKQKLASVSDMASTPQGDYTPTGESVGDDTDHGEGRISPMQPLSTHTNDQGSIQDLTTLIHQLSVNMKALAETQAAQARRMDEILEVRKDNPSHSDSSSSNIPNKNTPIDTSILPQELPFNDEGKLIIWELDQLRHKINDKWEVKPTILTSTNFTT